MNIFAGNVTIDGNKGVDLEFDFVESLGKNGNKTIFLFGETEEKNSQDLLENLEKKLGKIITFDLSIEGENKVKVIGEGYDEGLYELATFEGEGVSFDEIFDRFAEFEEVVSIREGGISEKFGNKKIKVDFVY